MVGPEPPVPGRFHVAVVAFVVLVVQLVKEGPDQQSLTVARSFSSSPGFMAMLVAASE